jgi:hypothetical protein
MTRVPVGGVEVADRRHGDLRPAAAEALDRDHVRPGRLRQHVAVEHGVRKRRIVAADVVVAGEPRDLGDHVQLARQAGAGHRRRDRPHPAASSGGAGAGEHARGGLHGALERRGACLLLAGDDRALLALAQRVAHDLGGARRHVEHGQGVLQAAEGQLLHDVAREDGRRRRRREGHQRDAAHAGQRLLVEVEARRRRAVSKVTPPSTIVPSIISCEIVVGSRVALLKWRVLNTCEASSGGELLNRVRR